MLVACIYIIFIQIRVHAGQEKTGVIQDSGNTHFVGFSLPEVQVSPHNIRAGSDFFFYVLYVVSTIILYTTCVTTIFFVASKTETDGVKNFSKKNPEIIQGVMIVVIVFILLEVSTELVMSIIWAVHVKDPLIIFTVFLAGLIYYSPFIISLYKICRKLYLYYDRNHKPESDRKNQNDVPYTKDIVLFKCFVWTIAYFAYIIMYAFFPAFVLAFAYPTRIITVFVFVATFFALSIVYITTYMKKGVNLKCCRQKRCPTYCDILLNTFVWVLLTITLIYFFLLIFALLYSLVIGRASVVSSAPLAILSLVPSILISLAAWIMKSTILDSTDCERKKQSDITNGNKLESNANGKENQQNDHEILEMTQFENHENDSPPQCEDGETANNTRKRKK